MSEDKKEKSAEEFTRDMIMRDICECHRDDPSHAGTICIDYEVLYRLITAHVMHEN